MIRKRSRKMSAQQDKVLPFNDFGADGRLDPFVIQVPVITSDREGQFVKDTFDGSPEIEGVVVMDGSHPIGIIMRTTFYQKIGSLYGLSLYMKRPVRILMETFIMSVDVNDNISRISIQAMSREQSKLYDYIVVYKNKTYLGVISIRLFLVELSKRNEAQISVLMNQQQKLLSAHEQELLLRRNLEYQSASVQNLLDHADEGFMWFCSDLIVKKDYSYKCMDIFGQSIGGTYYLYLMSQYFEEETDEVFRMVFESYFKNNSPVTDNVYLMLLPSDCMICGKNIHFEYRRIESGGEKAVMVILNDITEKISMEKAMENDRNRQRLLIKAFSAQAQIKQMLDEFQDIFSGGYKNFFTEDIEFQDSLNALFRAVHTFKGDFAQYGFINASGRLHQFEDELLSVVNSTDNVSMTDVEKIMSDADPNKITEEDLNTVYDVLGKSYFDKSEIISIPKARLREIEEQLRDGSITVDKTGMISLIKSLELRNVKYYLDQYQDYLEYLAGRVLKSMPVFIVEGDDMEVDGDLYGDFFKSLVHVFRNIMDHALESDEERLELGKAERGLIECRIAAVSREWFTLSISDDGRGIDLEKLRSKAISSRLHTAEEISEMADDKIIDLVFSDHLSTKDASDSLSGRGMGMSAVREACLKIGGSIGITTESGQGTTFYFTLPSVK
jgi:two-component system, chemotaxis family, sensor kinase CheA